MLAVFLVGGGFLLGRAAPSPTPVAPAHVAIANYARLLATDVCDELLAEVERAESADQPVIAKTLAQLMGERGEEARKASWKPVLSAFNKLQDEDGNIPVVVARKAILATREGLETVR